MEFVDTHCHIHFQDYQLDPEEVIAAAAAEGVTKLICVGCSMEDSSLGIQFAADHQRVWASIGVHPHEAARHLKEPDLAKRLGLMARQPKVVAVGECGLDYFYAHASKADQLKLLTLQLDLAMQANLPVIFHVRQAFDDFWPIYERYKGLRGVLHSFTDSQANLERALGHGLYIGVNGIATFTKDESQKAMYKAIPLDRLLLETDAPFLTPTPYRGTINQSKYVRVTAAYLSNLRDESIDSIAVATSANALALFGV